MSVARRPVDIPGILALSIVPSPLVSARRSEHGSSRFLCRPRTRGAAERRKAHTGSSITLARRDAALTARGDPGATGIAPLGAPPWRFPAAGPRFNSGSVHRIHVATCPPARSQDLADWVPYLPRLGSLASATGRHASGDAPHERERIWCSIDAICSQYRSQYVAKGPLRSGDGDVALYEPPRSFASYSRPW